VAFEIFTGNVPFRGETPIATIFKHLQEPPPLEGLQAEGLPARAVPVLRKALAKSADDRFVTAAEMVEALKRARAEFLSRPATATGPAVTMGATALGAQPQEAPNQGMPTPVPTNVPTAVRTAVSPAAAQVTEIRSKAAIERERKERERVQELKTACDGMEAALGRGTPDEAAAILAQAQADLGDTDPLPAYAARIEGARRQAAVHQLLRQATAQLRGQNFDEAQRLAEQAQQQDPSNAQARNLLDQVTTSRTRQAEEARHAAEEERRRAEETRQREEAARRAQDEEKRRADAEKKRAAEERRRAEEARQREEAARRAQELEAKRVEEERSRAEAAQRKAEAIAAAVAGVEGLIVRGDFDGASRAATEAVRAHGKLDSLQELPARIEAARRQAQEAATRQILDRAETLAASQRFDEAIQALREALRREPGHAQAKTALAKLEEQQKAQELARSVAALNLLVSHGHLEQARSELLAAEKTFGKNDALKRLRKGLQDLEKKQAAAAAAVQAERTEFQPRPSLEPLVAAEPARLAAEVLRPAAQATRPAARPASSGPSLGLYVALSVVVVALTGGGLGWWLAHREEVPPSPAPSVEPDISPSTDTAETRSSLPTPSPIPPPDLAPATGSGLLIVDALPWGEVTAVLDSNGKRHTLGDSPFTPFVLGLPPGEYKISIKGPDSRQPIALTATIKDAAVERKMAEFRRIDADDYLKRAGF
jgi:tetratricopeptide (TPR) repeat protein